MRHLLICCACAVVALSGCVTTIASVDPSAITPPTDEETGVLYGTVVGATRFDIFTDEGRIYAITASGPTSSPQLFIVKDRYKKPRVTITRVLVHWIDGYDYWWDMDKPYLFWGGQANYVGRFTFLDNGQHLRLDPQTYRDEDLARLKAVYGK